MTQSVGFREALRRIKEVKRERSRQLDLIGLGLSSVPPEIGSLKKLRFLYLNNNQLTELPPEIGSLSSLTHLYLDENQISELPSEIGSLSKLEQLFVNNNRLTALPPELGSLPLEWLDARVNDLNSLNGLPPELRQLEPTLRVLLLHGNPHLNLSPTVLGPEIGKPEFNPDTFPSPRSILDAYFTRQSGVTRPLNEVKLILVGRGGAGKTSVVRALQGLPFQRDEKSTPGIAITDLKIQNCPSGDVTAHVWDFAGQVITHALHQFFFSVRSVYVLVLTGRENSERADAEYWLRLIQAFGAEDGVGPPVLIALNKWDVDGCRPRLDRGVLQERYPNIRGFIELDCETQRGVDDLKSALQREVAALKWVREPFKAAWDDIRRELTQSDGAAYLPYAEFRQLCDRRQVKDIGEQDSLAEILHNLGSALNYRNDPRLREATVLKPHWLTENVYALVRQAEKRAGLLKPDDIAAALHLVADAAMRDYLLRLMERFEIAYPSRSDAPVMWLVPQALPDVQPAGAEKFAQAPEAVRLRYTYEALPEGLVARAVVRLHEFIEELDGNKLQWASGAILTREGARALLRTEPHNRVQVVVVGPADARRQLAGLCQAELRDIHREIQGLDPLEETQVNGAWVPVATLEADERLEQLTGVPTKDKGTVRIDPGQANDAYSMSAARDEDVWKPSAFICYSKTNLNPRKRLESELKILKNEGLLAGHWHDRMIDPGEPWDARIQRELAEADVVVILLSAASLATDYIWEREIPRALEQHAAGEAVIVPLVLEACRWTETELGALQALPEKGKPINEWTPRAKGWKSVADGLAAIFKKLQAKPGPRKLLSRRLDGN